MQWLKQLFGPNLDSLVYSLKHNQGASRAKAAEKLGTVGNLVAVEPLIAALSDADCTVRLEAARALGKLGDKRAQGPLLTVLRDGESSVRCSAAVALGALGTADAVMPLIGALKDEDPCVRGGVAEALGRLGDNSSVAPLIVALSDRDNKVRSLAILALGQIGDRRAVQPLIPLLQDPRHCVGIVTAQTLERFQETWAGDLAIERELKEAAQRESDRTQEVDHLIHEVQVHFSANDPAKRSSAARALGALGDERATGALCRTLESSSVNELNASVPDFWNSDFHSLRRDAAAALGRLGDRDAVEPLLRAVFVDHFNVVNAAVGALKELRDPRAVEFLIAAFQERSIPSSLTYIYGKEVRKDDLARRACLALRDLGDARAVEPFIAALNNRHSNDRQSIVEALGIMGDKRAIDPLIAALRDQDNSVRSGAAVALAQLGDPKAIEPLAAAAKNGLWQASVALGTLGDRRAIEALEFALYSANPDTCRIAASVLEQLQSRGVEAPEIKRIFETWKRSPGFESVKITRTFDDVTRASEELCAEIKAMALGKVYLGQDGKGADMDNDLLQKRRHTQQRVAFLRAKCQAVGEKTAATQPVVDAQAKEELRHLTSDLQAATGVLDKLIEQIETLKECGLEQQALAEIKKAEKEKEAAWFKGEHSMPDLTIQKARAVLAEIQAARQRRHAPGIESSKDKERKISATELA